MMYRDDNETGARRIPRSFWVSAALYVLFLLASAFWRKTGAESFDAFFQKEKSGAEALTFLLFFCAGVAAIAEGAVKKRAGAFIYALVCFFIAFEDVQWGYSYLGYEMPEFFRDHVGVTGKMGFHSLKAPLNMYLCYFPLLACFIAFLVARGLRYARTRHAVEALPFLLPIIMIPAGLLDDPAGNIAQTAVGYWALCWPLIRRAAGQSKETG